MSPFPYVYYNIIIAMFMGVNKVVQCGCQCQCTCFVCVTAWESRSMD
jgi:hypothetical protein